MVHPSRETEEESSSPTKTTMGLADRFRRSVGVGGNNGNVRKTSKNNPHAEDTNLHHGQDTTPPPPTTTTAKTKTPRKLSSLFGKSSKKSQAKKTNHNDKDSNSKGTNDKEPSSSTIRTAILTTTYETTRSKSLLDTMSEDDDDDEEEEEDLQPHQDCNDTTTNIVTAESAAVQQTWKQNHKAGFMCVGLCGSGSTAQEYANDEQYEVPMSSNTPQESSLSKKKKSTKKKKRRRHGRLSEDPTVQESIECIFASQLEEAANELLLSSTSTTKSDEDNKDTTTKPTTDKETNVAKTAEAAAVSSDTTTTTTTSALDQQTRHILQNSLSTESTTTTSTSTSSSDEESPAKTTTTRPHGAVSSPPTTTQKITLQHIATFDPTLDVREPPTLRNTRIQSAPFRRDDATATTDDMVLSPTTTTGGAIYTSSSPPQTTAATTTTKDTTASSCREACYCSTHKTPSVPPEQWPQGPIMLRPTPGTGMKIKGIRYVSSTEYIATPSSNHTWWDIVKQQQQQQQQDNDTANKNENHSHHICQECMLLPINNGNESKDQTLVTDFESPLFEGTLLLRIRHAPSNMTGQVEEDAANGYFHGMNRRYQAVIQGKFRTTIPEQQQQALSMTECVTGMSFYRKYGKLPPKWIVKGALKVLSFFAPQLDCQMDGDAPCSITPLGSTPQVLKVESQDKFNKNNGNNNTSGNSLASMQEEPTLANETLLGEASDASTSLTRARFRKKAFDKLYVAKSKDPQIDPTKVYTFEFLQHLVNFTEMEIELGSFLGSVQLAEVLNGQPLQIMAATTQQQSQHEGNGDTKKKNGGRMASTVNNKNALWAFDIWHEKLIPASLKHDG